MATTGHESEAIDVQGLKASLQKLKTEKVDPKVTEGYYYNKKFYKEDAHTTEITGVGGRIYIDKPTNREYRWDGTKYVLLKSEVDGSFVNEGTFTYRPTAGAIDVESKAVGEGGAQIECVKGNTIAWNQLVLNGNFSDDSAWENVYNGTLSISNNIATLTADSSGEAYIGNIMTLYAHKYLFNVSAKPSVTTNIIIRWENLGVNVEATADAWTTCKGITNITYNAGTLHQLQLSFYAISANDSVQLKNVQIIDLTLIYGEGNEPTTVAEFEVDYQKWFGKPLTYEEYDEGSLRSVEMTGIKTTGFNQWDEEYLAGYGLNTATGAVDVDSNRITSKNFIPILPDTFYCPRMNAGAIEIAVGFYDKEKNYIGGSWNYHSNEVFKTPHNASYMIFTRYPSETYENDICINLVHSGDRNGDYEPYWEHTANLPVTSLKGKLNGEGNLVTVFPDGMKKAGTVYDEIVRRGNQTVAIKRIGSVDLGSLTWIYYDNSFYLNFSQAELTKHNAICSFYQNWTNYYPFDNSDKSIYVGSYIVDGIHIKDTSYTDAATFKAAMQGVILYYELATPEEYIIEDIDFPTEYPVDDYGTEEILADSAKSLAPTLDIRYGLNATDTLRNLPTKYVSAIVEQNFTEEQKTRARINIGLDNLSRLGGGYGTCYTDATTAAKTVSISHFLLLVNGIVSVRFTKAISVDNATLNVSGSGAKPIFINGAALQKGLIKAGMTATLQYDGTNWNIISTMGLGQSTTPSSLYVDMGLPSGTLWAVANIDVTTQSGFAEVDGKPSPFKYECSFFSWGNVDGHNPISDSAFDYDFGTSNDGPYAQTPAAALTADAGLSFDAARANLGSPWRDPSADDFVELFDNIDFVQADGETVIDASETNKLVTVNNVTGIYLKSKVNGNLLFFPCSGSGLNQSWNYRGSSGYYLSRSLYSQTYSYRLYFSTGMVNPHDDGSRFLGCSRRAVQ